MLRNISKVALCSAAMLTVTSAWAVDLTDDMAVSLTVESTCTVAADPLTFTSYDTAADSDASANLTVSCTNGTEYKVYLEGSTGGVRTLTNGADTLNYSLYTDAGRTAAFPESEVDATEATAGTSDATVTVYGRIPDGQTAAAGEYVDSVTVTLAYDL